MEAEKSSQYIDQYQGLSLPVDNRLPWNPWSTNGFQEDGSDGNRLFSHSWHLHPGAFQESYKNRQSWNLWSSEAFQENESNKNRKTWNPWLADVSQETRSYRNRQTYEFSPIACSLDEMQSESRNLVTDQSLTFQKTFSPNLSESFEEFNPFMRYASRRKKRKYRTQSRSRRVMRQTTYDTLLNSSHERYQDHPGWIHTRVLKNSLQTNLPPRSAKINSSKNSSSFSNESYKNPYKFQSVTCSKFTKTSSDSPRVTSETAVSYTNLKSHNLSSKVSSSIMGNTFTCNSSVLNDSNRLTTMGRKKSQRSSVTTRDFENSSETNDVIYLYSVDSSSEGKMILEIDLQSDGMNLTSECTSPKAVNLPPSSKVENAVAKQSAITVEKSEVAVSSSRKRKLPNSVTANKRQSYRPECTICHLSYDAVTDKKANMYISSSCSHIFCGSCIGKNGKLEECPECKIKFFHFRRLYL